MEPASKKVLGTQGPTPRSPHPGPSEQAHRCPLCMPGWVECWPARGAAHLRPVSQVRCWASKTPKVTDRGQSHAAGTSRQGQAMLGGIRRGDRGGLRDWDPQPPWCPGVGWVGLSELPAGCCGRREGLALGGPGTALGPGAGQDGLGPQLGTQGAAGWVVRRLVLAGLWGGWGWAGRRGGRLTAPTQLSVRSELRP